MTLKELIKKEGIDAVRDKTRIAEKFLNAFVESDYRCFSKPQALGFIGIIEREYRIKLRGEREQVELFFGGAQAQDENMVPKESKEGTESSIMPLGDLRRRRKWWIVLAVLAVIALFLAILLWIPGKTVEPGSALQAVSGMAEENVSPVSPAVSDDDGTEEMALETAEADDSDASATGSEAASSEETAAAASSEASNPSVAARLGSVVMLPNIKLWYGMVDLENRKRSQGVVPDQLMIPENGRFLLITGHGSFAIEDLFENRYAYRDSRKHYFYIDNGLVYPIDRDKFVEMNNGRPW